MLKLAINKNLTNKNLVIKFIGLYFVLINLNTIHYDNTT